MSPRTLVVDPSPFVRLAVRTALTEAGIVVAEECATADAALRAATSVAPDVILFDAEVDAEFRVLAEIHREAPDAALIVLSPDASEARAMAAVRAGACGFLPKDTSPDRLPAIVRGAVDGEAAIPRRLVRRLLGQVSAVGHRAPLGGALAEPLTQREWEVLELLSRGFGDRHVGVELSVSEVTVRRHAATAARKLRAASREDAVAAFRRLAA